MVQGVQINVRILKQCREQMYLSLKEVKKTVPKIGEIEDAHKKPTPKQLTKLANLYQVPRWVFIEDRLPKEYHYTQKPTFRRFKNSSTFNNFKIRQWTSPKIFLFL